MKIFRLNRKEDVSGTSGVGNSVAYGVVLSTGRVILTWRTEFSSIAIYDNMESLEHIHSHNGKTVVQYLELPKKSLNALEAFISGKALSDHPKAKKS